MRETTPERVRFWALLGVSLLASAALRLLYFSSIEGDLYLSSLPVDARAYHEKALRILSGELVAERAFYQDPLYPYFLSLLYAFAGSDPWAARAFQMLLGVLSTGLVAVLGMRLGGLRVAALSVVLYLATGLFYFYEGLLGKEALGVFLLLLAQCALFRAAETGRATHWLLAGAGMGLATLTRGNLLAMAPVFLLYILCQRFGPPALRIRAGAGYLAGFALLIAPATVHNLLAEGDPVLLTFQGGPNFYYGNGPLAQGGFQNPERVRLVPQYEEGDFRQEALRRSGRTSMSSSEIDRFWLREGLRAIASDPGRFLALLATKSQMFVSDHELPDNFDYAFARRQVPVLGAFALSFGVLLALAAAGLLALRGESRRLWPALIFLGTYAGSVVLFHMASRYRLVVMPLLAVLAAYFLERALCWARSGQWRALLSGSALATGVATASFWPYAFVPAEVSSRFDQPLIVLGMAASGAGDEETALRHFEEALAIAPGNAVAHFNRGNSLLRLGSKREALRAYALSTRIDPYGVDAYRNLALLHLKEQRTERARAIIETGVRHNPRQASLHDVRGLVLHALGDPAAALAAFDRAVALDPRLASAHYNRACALALEGDIQAARSSLERAIALNPANRELARRDPDLESLY